MIIDEVWTIEYTEAQCFLTENGFESIGRESGFVRGNLRVSLQQLEPKSLGPIALHRTRVLIDCPCENELSDFYNGFRLRFLKGGG